MKVYAASIVTQQIFNDLWKTTFHKTVENGNVTTKTEKFPLTLYNEQGNKYTINNNIIDEQA